MAGSQWSDVANPEHVRVTCAVHAKPAGPINATAAMSECQNIVKCL